mgnify:CR=1 FL=1
MMGGQKTAAGALLISVFLAGVLGGAAGTKLLDRSPWEERMEQAPLPGYPGPRSPRMGRHGGGPRELGITPMWFSRRLADELDLSEEQEEDIRSVLETRRQRAEEAMADAAPVLRAQFDSVQMEIREILTPEQRTLFDEFRDVERERAFRRFPGVPADSPPGRARERR